MIAYSITQKSDANCGWISSLLPTTSTSTLPISANFLAKPSKLSLFGHLKWILPEISHPKGGRD
jgi:hypothetical protein